MPTPSAYTSQMGSVTKQPERGSVFPIGDAVGIDKGASAPDPLLLAAAMEACPEKLAILENGCLLYTNRAFAESFGYSHGSTLQGEPLARLIPASQLLAYVPQSPGGAGSFPNPASDPVFDAARRDGTQLKVQMSCAGFPAGEKNLLILGVREVPFQDREPSSGSSPMESLGHLVSAVAHDFNNLLTGILLYADLLEASLETNNPLRSYVTEIRRAGGHSAELVHQLMAVARPQAGQPGAHSWHGVISAMRNLLQRLLGENIELSMDMRANHEEDVIAMDAVPMRQVVLNLLLNARDAMPEGGRILLTVQPCEECRAGSHCGGQPCIVLAIADTGCGMDSATRSRLFQTVFTTKAAGKGTGLGLSNVGRIVKEHGGTIQVESELQKGTRVSIHLPRARRGPAHEFHYPENKANS